MTAPQLRDYQEEAVSAVMSMLRQYNNVLLVLSTGAGKTFCYAYIAMMAKDSGRSAMIVAHRAELISQGSISLAQIGVTHQIIGPKSLERKIKILHIERLGKSYIDPFSSISVGSVQTIGRRLESIKHQDLLMIDEAHHAPAGMWLKIINHLNTKHLGLTATPCRSDNVPLGVVYDEMFVGKSMKDLIRDGNLCEYIVYSTPEDIHLDEVKRVKSGESKGDYNTKDLEKQMDKPKIVGRAVQHYEKYAKGKSCLVFAVSVAHSEHIANEFCNAGYNFVAISGKTDDSERYKAVDDLRNKRIDGIVNCDLFGEGTDISGVDCVIMMRPISESAFGLFSQQVGRGLRTSKGKEYAVILDMVGNFQRHGFPEDKCEWSLEAEDKKTKKSSSETVPATKTCPSCFLTHKPAPLCPGCGYAYPTDGGREYEQVDGDLVALERDREIQERRQEQNAMLRDAKTPAELAAIDAKLGLGRGATAHKQRAIEEKKQAIETLNKALKYWKETCMWGDIWKHEEVFPLMFDCTEKEARGYGAVRMHRITDKMRAVVTWLRDQYGRDYDPDRVDWKRVRAEVLDSATRK